MKKISFQHKICVFIFKKKIHELVSLNMIPNVVISNKKYTKLIIKPKQETNNAKILHLLNFYLTTLN